MDTNRNGLIGMLVVCFFLLTSVFFIGTTIRGCSKENNDFELQRMQFNIESEKVQFRIDSLNTTKVKK